MTSNEIRKAFLAYFQNLGHTVVASSPLIPGDDPTLLFTNAGMVQFKDIFLGLESRSYTRATSSQRCVRAGGKHNDLENVGHTARHHTFFEMLGNFSFGDYFKRDAIRYAWEFLTQVLQLPPGKLWVTVYTEDDEAADIWLNEMKVDPARFSRCGASDNFWAMGDTGPCGPCTEIFYDHGPEIWGGPPGSPEADGDRYIEIWNLVFMQYERSSHGELKPLPKPSVDTGMGLERLSAVLQGVHNNYDTDLFQPIIKAAADLAGINDLSTTSLRVIADHIRSCSFLIIDGVIPSNEGRGYVLRRIIRRAVRHGNKLGLTEPFFHQLVAPLVAKMGEAYPELTKAQAQIERVLLLEEQQFARTLATGLKLLEQDIAQLTDKVIPGTTLFKLYDTYGFPTDLTADIARERGLNVDLTGFEKEMAKQRQLSQQQQKFTTDYTERLTTAENTDFTGYEHLQHEAIIIGLVCNQQAVDSLQNAELPCMVILDRTPFYAEGGGQVGDSGWLIGSNGEFAVTTTQKEGNVYLHHGFLRRGTLQLNDKVYAEVNSEKRYATALNHSATHLLHAALRQHLGEHVMQKGSLVEPERLRFDFTHFAPLTPEQLKTIERLVNAKIRANLPVETHTLSPEVAKKQGALAFFGEKYGEQVRMLAMGNFSKELCGGTHVKRTGDIGICKIINETGIAAGIRRIEAVTGEYALKWLDKVNEQLTTSTQLLKTNRDDLPEKIKKLLLQQQQLEKHLQQLQNRLANSARDALMQQVISVNAANILVAKLDEVNLDNLRETVDKLKDKLGHGVIVLGSILEQRVVLVAGVTSSLTSQLNASKLINAVASHIGGKGGGRAEFAQAGGNQPEGLPAALQAALEWVKNQLNS